VLLKRFHLAEPQVMNLLFSDAEYSKLHCYRIDAWAIRRPWLTFVNALTSSILELFALQGTRRFASCAWPTVLWRLGNRWKWKGESWFHYRKVLFVGVVEIIETWFYLV